MLADPQGTSCSLGRQPACPDLSEFSIAVKLRHNCKQKTDIKMQQKAILFDLMYFIEVEWAERCAAGPQVQEPRAAGGHRETDRGREGRRERARAGKLRRRGEKGEEERKRGRKK